MEIYAVMIDFIIVFVKLSHALHDIYQHEDILNIPNPHQRRGGEMNSTMIKMHLLKKMSEPLYYVEVLH